MKNFKDLEWFDHGGTMAPVASTTIVVYRTEYHDKYGSSVSHIHAPVRAELINWSAKPSIGRIYKYAVVAK